MHDLVSIPKALVRPDHAFAESTIFRVPKSLLVLVMFLLCVTGARLGTAFAESAHGKELLLAEREAQMDSLMAGAPTAVREQQRQQTVAAVLGQQSALSTSMGIVVSGVGFVLLAVEMWLAGMVVSQFFGGQEDRRGWDRHSITLFLVAFVPLALKQLFSGIVLSAKDPDVAGNALTYKDYLATGAVRFDLFSLVGLHGLTGFLATLAGILTNPFYLWTFAIVTLGGRHVYRLSLRGALGLSVVLVLVLSLQTTLLKSVGMATEL